MKDEGTVVKAKFKKQNPWEHDWMTVIGICVESLEIFWQIIGWSPVMLATSLIKTIPRYVRIPFQLMQNPIY